MLQAGPGIATLLGVVVGGTLDVRDPVTGAVHRITLRCDQRILIHGQTEGPGEPIEADVLLALSPGSLDQRIISRLTPEGTGLSEEDANWLTVAVGAVCRVLS